MSNFFFWNFVIVLLIGESTLHHPLVPSVIILMITNQTSALWSSHFKQILDEVFVITRIIKVKRGVTS